MQIPSYTQASPLPAPSRLQRISNGIGGFFLKSWDLIVTTFFGLLCLAAVGAPILSYFNLNALARPLFTLLGRLCGQIASHTFYIGGHQCGLCVHCLAIYASIGSVGVIFALSKKRLPGIPWWLLILLALPLAYDGFSQMFGLRESTWEIRVLTGALFGLGLAWFGLPLVQKMLKETTPALHAGK